MDLTVTKTSLDKLQYKNQNNLLNKIIKKSDW